MTALVHAIKQASVPLVTSAGVVAEVWRGGGNRQVPVAYLLKLSTVIDLDRVVARTLGRILGQSGSRDVVDAHAAFLARERGWPVLTSDPNDLLEIDPALDIEEI